MTIRVIRDQLAPMRQEIHIGGNRATRSCEAEFGFVGNRRRMPCRAKLESFIAEKTLENGGLRLQLGAECPIKVRGLQGI